MGKDKDKKPNKKDVAEAMAAKGQYVDPSMLPSVSKNKEKKQQQEKYEYDERMKRREQRSVNSKSHK